MINAFINLNESINKRLIIIGDSPERESLEKLVKESKNPQSIVFVGNVNDNKLNKGFLENHFDLIKKYTLIITALK